MDASEVKPSGHPTRNDDELIARMLNAWFCSTDNSLTSRSEMPDLFARMDAVLSVARSETARWIPLVADSLPANTTAYDVLARTINGRVRVEAACEVHGLYKDAVRNEEQCVFTHWMPIPDAPK